MKVEHSRCILGSISCRRIDAVTFTCASTCDTLAFCSKVSGHELLQFLVFTFLSNR